MEVLSDILESMRVRGSVYFCDALMPPWSKSYVELNQPSFHLVRGGHCWVSSGDMLDCLQVGDLVFIAADRDYELGSHPPEDPDHADQSETLLLCGYCEFNDRVDHPLLKALPSLTIVRRDELRKHAWLKSTLDQLSTEYFSQKPGNQIAINKLTEVVIIELIRIDFGRSEKNNFVGALYDKKISLALKLMHKEPERSWTLDLLASETASSRASFSRKFRSLVGQTMFEYLTALRMRKARELLRSSGEPIHTIANYVGYESELAFVKTFKKVMGTTPTKYRRSTRPALARTSHHDSNLDEG